MGRSKKTVMIILCVAIFIMVVGFAAFGTTLTITGTASVTSEWNVVFTDVTIQSKTTGVSIIEDADVSGTSVTFHVGLTVPGDEIVYVVTVENQGTLDAIIQNINATSSDNPAIDFEISNIQIGDILEKKTSTTFNVTISFDRNVTSSPSNKSNALTVDIAYVQKMEEIVPETPPVPTTPLIDKLQNDIDNASSDANIDFGAISSDTNGKGMYYTSTNTQDNKIVYYYRGEVENNYVQFGEMERCVYNNEPVIYSLSTNLTYEKYPDSEQCLKTNVCDLKNLFKQNHGINYRYSVGLTKERCTNLGGTFLNNENATYDFIDILWRIVRVNEDGSVRLITDNYVKEQLFNAPTNYIFDNAYVGYMYGTKGATGDNAYELTHTNTHDSGLKDYLDDWYQNETNLYVYNDLMSTTAGFCNDRSVASGPNQWHYERMRPG